MELLEKCNTDRLPQGASCRTVAIDSPSMICSYHDCVFGFAFLVEHIIDSHDHASFSTPRTAFFCRFLNSGLRWIKILGLLDIRRVGSLMNRICDTQKCVYLLDLVFIIQIYCI